MRRRNTGEIRRNSPENKENSTVIPVPVLNIPSNDNASRPNSAREPAPYYTQAEQDLGYIDPQQNAYLRQRQAAPPAASPRLSVPNWFAGRQGYMYTAQECYKMGYTASYADISKLPNEATRQYKHETRIETEEVRLRVLEEQRIMAFNARINALLHDNGFINRVDINKGITASVAVFKYVGHDPSIMAITKFGFVMVKLPPYTAAPQSIKLATSASHDEHDGYIQYVRVALPEKTDAQRHAEDTYKNECNIINKMAPISENETRPHVLVKEFCGQKIILNSPIFYDEEEFAAAYHRIINREYQQLSSCSESISDQDGNDDIVDAASQEQELIQSLLLHSFLNLQCYMHRLSASEEDPVHIINTIFYSSLFALNDLHNHGFVHADLATRNIVVRINGSVSIVDFGTGDTFNPENGNSTSNIRYAQVPMMYNYDALKADYTIGVITDYISFQKTMLQTIADFIGIDFYSLPRENLPNNDGIKHVTIDYLLQFPDRVIMDRVVDNLKIAVNKLATTKMKIAFYAMHLIKQWEPYFKHDHNPALTFAQLQEENNKSFNACINPSHGIEENEQPRMRRSNSSINLHFFNRSSENSNNDANATDKPKSLTPRK